MTHEELLRLMNDRFDQLEAKVDSRCDALETEVGTLRAKARLWGAVTGALTSLASMVIR